MGSLSPALSSTGSDQGESAPSPGRGNTAVQYQESTLPRNSSGRSVGLQTGNELNMDMSGDREATEEDAQISRQRMMANEPR